MHRSDTPARAAWLLRSAARHLETIDPNPVLGSAIADAVTMSDDRPSPLQPHFAESAPGNLAFFVHPGGSIRDGVALSVSTMRNLVGKHFGREATRWLDGRIEPAADAVEQGFFAGGFDRDGVTEGAVGFDLPPHLVAGLPRHLAKIVHAALAHLPGARLVSTVVRCGRSSGTQQVTVEALQELPLANLRPLMEELGLAHQHASIMSATAFLLGARFTLPPGSARITLRPIRNGVEMRIDVVLEHIPDPPPQMLSLLRLWMSERPRSVAGLDRWLAAFTPDGWPNAGDVTVASVWVRPDVPARVALFLRPAALDTASGPTIQPVASPWD